MKIVEGGLPEDKAWRALVLLAPGEELGVAWKLSLAMTRANSGELVAAVIIHSIDHDLLVRARETVNLARKACETEDPVYIAIVQADDYRKASRTLVHLADIDLLIASAEAPGWKNLEKMPCSVAVVRGESYNPLREGEEATESPTGQRKIQSILVPTSGGPNSANALSYLLPLTAKDVSVTALYVAPERLGAHEVALGRARLRQTLSYIDAEDRIESKLITTPSITQGIIDEASGDYDMVMIGATRESSLDKALFGNIPEAVIRECQKPVVVVREPVGTVGSIFRRLSWTIQPIIPRLNLRERTQAYVRIRRDARPDTDFYVLIGLAAGIAGLGLLADSAAVVIGAMLVAPLMSPIAGTGLSMVLGDTRFLRLAFGAVLRGALLALLMGFLVGLLPLQEPMTSQVLARTQPTLLDVAVALLSGMAVAYALCRSEATAALPGVAIAAALVPPLAASGISLANGYFQEFGGALLLFLTNFVAIAVASAFVYLVLGFKPSSAQKERQAVRSRSARIGLVLLIFVTVIVAYTTYLLAQSSAAEARIQELADAGVSEITKAQLVEIEIGELSDDVLQLDITVTSAEDIPHQQVVELQKFIATELQRDLAMTLTVIPTTQLDPFVLPTETPTPTVTKSPTPGPTTTFTPFPTDVPFPTEEPTFTHTPFTIPEPTAIATMTPTHTPTITPSPTPLRAVVDFAYGLNMRLEPTSTSDLVILLEPGSVVVLLEGEENSDEGTWQRIQFAGQDGWVLADFLGQLVGLPSES